MSNLRLSHAFSLLVFSIIFGVGLLPAAGNAIKVTVDWSKVVRVSRTTPTFQVVVNPPLRRGASLHDPAFRAVHDLGCDIVRYVPWLPYPKLAVAELEPPRDGKTFWDFSLIDPMTEDFINATAGHSVMLNFSTIPEWMLRRPGRLITPTIPIRSRGITPRAAIYAIPARRSWSTITRDW